MKISEAQNLLAQARMLEARAQALEAGVGHSMSEPGKVPGSTNGAFGDLMRNSVDQVNDAMAGADAKTAAFLREDPGANLVETMVAVNKAKVSFRAMVEVRNHLIQAYKDIANMPI